MKISSSQIPVEFLDVNLVSIKIRVDLLLFFDAGVPLN